MPTPSPPCVPRLPVGPGWWLDTAALAAGLATGGRRTVSTTPVS